MIDILDFISSFIDKIASFFSFVVDFPIRIRGIFNFICYPFVRIFGDVGYSLLYLFYGLLAFLLIYFVVKLVIDLL